MTVGQPYSLSSYTDERDDDGELKRIITLKNLAKVNDLVTITATFLPGQGADWALIQIDPIAIEASGEKPLYISVTAPESAAGGQATLTIRAESGGNPSIFDETTLTFRVTVKPEDVDRETDQLSEEGGLDPIWLVSIVLIIGLGSAAVFGLQQKSKGAFGSSKQSVEDFSDEWAGMEDPANQIPPSTAAVPQTAPPPAAAPPPQPQAPPPQAAAPPPQPQAPPPPAAAPPPQPQAPPPPAAAPPPPAAAPAAPMILTVTVPDGVMAGQQIQIKAPTGQLVNVKVPEGCGPGSQFKIQI